MLTIDFLTEQVNNNFQDMEMYDFKIDSFAETIDENDQKGLNIAVKIIAEYENKFYRIMYTLTASNAQVESYIGSITFTEVTPENQMTVVWVDKNE